MPLSKQPAFTASYFDSKTKPAGTPQGAKDQVKAFKMEEIVSHSAKPKSFLYDSESARNFDQANVNRAKVGVKEIVADAIQKAKTMALEIRIHSQKEGFDAGYADGFKKGEEEAKKEFSPFLETIHDLIQTLTLFRNKMYPKVEREMIEMVTSLAKKVIHHELSTREESVQEMIQLAVQSVLDKESMTIKINPDDKTHAESFRPELHQLFGEIKNITFEAHSGIERGGCIIETNFGTVDARLEKLDEQIDKILNMAPPPVADDLPNHGELPVADELPSQEEPSATEEFPSEEEPPVADPLPDEDEPDAQNGLSTEEESFPPTS